MQQPAADRLRRADSDLGALQRVQQIGRGIERGAVERQIDKALRQRLAAGQGDLPGRAAAIVNDEAFQHIVDLVERDIEGERSVAVDLRLVFEVADAAGRQHDPLQHEVGRRGRQGGAQQKQAGEQASEKGRHHPPPARIYPILSDR